MSASSTWEFIKRHKGKLILAGGTVGALVWVNRVMSNWERSWDTSSSRDFVSEVRKKEIHFENTIQTCNSTCITLAPKILDILDSILDTDTLVEQLKRSKGTLKPEERLKLWEDLKVRIFTRLAAEVYTVCLFSCYLRVQLAVIGGYVYVDSSESGNLESLNRVAPYLPNEHNNGQEADSRHVQHKYLSLIQSFYQDGIHDILEPLGRAVEHSLSDFSLKDKVSLADLKTICEKIKQSMSFTLASPTSGVSRYLIRPERLINHSDNLNSSSSSTSSLSDAHEARGQSSAPIPSTSSGKFAAANNGRRDSLSESDRKLLERMLNETQDILESDDFRRVLTAAIDVGYSIMQDLLLGVFVRMSDEITLGGLESSTMGTSFMSSSIDNSKSMSMSISMLQSANGLINKGDNGQDPASHNLENGSDEGVEADTDSDKEQAGGQRSSDASAPQLTDLPNGGSFTNPHSIQIAMAKLLPAIRAAIGERKKPDEQLVLVRHLLCLDVLNCFAANIYEAFCVPPESK